MTVVSVAFDGTRLDAAEILGSVWTDSGGKAAVLENDLVYQGNQAVSEKVGTTMLGVGYTDLAGVDMETTPRVALIKATISNLGILNNEGSTGAIAMLGSGGHSTDHYSYYVKGKDTWDPSLRWLFAFIDPNVTAYRDATAGTPDVTGVDWFAFKAQFSGAAKVENVSMDAIEWCESGKGLTLTAGTGSDPPGTFADFVAYDEGNIWNRWGVVYSLAGAIFCNLTLTVGSATATRLVSANEQIVFTGLWLDSGAQGLAFDLQNASSSYSLTNDTFSSDGCDNLKRFFDTDHQVDGTNEELDIVTHGYETGDAALYSKQGGTEAIGLTDATEYWIEAVTVDTLSLHTSRQNAMTSATPVDLTASTSGNGENHSLRRQPYTTPHLTVSGTSGTMAVSGCSFIRFGDVALTSKPTVAGCAFVSAWSITPGGATISSCTFDGAMTVEGEELMSDTVAHLEAIGSSEFVAGVLGGHGWRVTGTVSQLDIAGITWTDYGPDPELGNGHSFDSEMDVDGTNDEIDYTSHGWTTGDPAYYSRYDPTDGSLGTEAIGMSDGDLVYVRSVTADSFSLHNTRYAAENNLDKINLTASGVGNGETHTFYSADAAIVNATAGDMTVSVTSGGNTPSVRNVAGAITTVSAAVAVTVKPIVVGSELRAYQTGTAIEVDGVENSSGTSQALSLVSGQAVDLVVLSVPTPSRPNDLPRVPIRLENVSFTADQDLIVAQQFDRNFHNP